MSLKFYAVDDHCGSKAMSEFRALEERFDSLDDCCRIKFPLSVSDCCEAGEDGCLRSGHLKFIPVSTFLPRQIHFNMFTTCKLLLLTTFCSSFFSSKKWQDQVCYTKDENLLADWEGIFAKTTLKECCEHNMHYDVASCCENSEGVC